MNRDCRESGSQRRAQPVVSRVLEARRGIVEPSTRRPRIFPGEEGDWLSTRAIGSMDSDALPV